jgi:hypothetical protein
MTLALLTLKNKYHIPYAEFISGGAAGLGAGFFVAPMEAIKVYQQTTLAKDRQYFSSKFIINTLKTIPTFSGIFGAVCALEFSVNEQIKHQYGDKAGIAASAITGAAFLTSADQILYRKHLGQTTYQAINDISKNNVIGLWTGFTPMVLREGMFVFSMLYLGPEIARVACTDQKDKPDLTQRAGGQLIAGLLTNTLSHPFDTIARAMQIKSKTEPHVRPSVFNAARGLAQNPASFFRGLPPRLLLASYGQALVKELYTQANSTFNNEDNLGQEYVRKNCG